MGCVVRLPVSTTRTPLFGGRTVTRVDIFDYYQVYVAPLVGLTPGEGVGEPVEELAFGNFLLALDELYTVTIRVTDEEDAGAAAHRVRLALEVDATGLFELPG